MPSLIFTPIKNPSFPLDIKETVRVNEIQFGDGYAARSADGLNAMKLEVVLNWENVTKVEKDNILSFLRARAGVVSFTCPFMEEPHLKWICKEWGASRIAFDSFVVSATLTQVFEA